ncbi:MAG TPA: sodium:solute symporter, partial [Saprospiraceae bacterium]|nr:sodium:solute symporter [Saprospiraceae bacterium]
NVDQRYLQNLGSAAKFLPSRANVGPLIGYWLDSGLLLIFGGIPWQVYFQRVLAAKNEEVAMRLSIGAGFVCLLAAIPAILIGMIANTTDWTVFGIQFDNPSLSLPLVIRYLTPGWVAVVGLGAILAAVTSSMDSSMLSASSMFSWNILKPLSRRPVSINKSVRISIWVIGLVTVFIALKVDSIYALWFLCSDLVYCLLFPALTLALFDLKTHRQGIIAGLIVALVIRSSGGEPLLHIAPWFPYNQSAEGIILLPFKTMAMLANFLVAMSFSRWFLKPKTA